jgi:hypothetical protein
MTNNISRDRGAVENNKLAPLAGKGRRWVWFAAGFCLVFFGMSLFVTMYSMHPSGQFVVECRLWQYYMLEIERALHSSGNLGPASGSSSAAVTTAIEHLLCSVVGGAVMLGIVWGVRRIRGRKEAAN